MEAVRQQSAFHCLYNIRPEMTALSSIQLSLKLAIDALREEGIGAP